MVIELQITYINRICGTYCVRTTNEELVNCIEDAYRSGYFILKCGSRCTYININNVTKIDIFTNVGDVPECDIHTIKSTTSTRRSLIE